MSFGHALYYPHINLSNTNWLKYALLFWDKISRIVPTSVHPSDSEDVIRIRSETGFIEDYSPDESDISNTFRSFSKWLENTLQSGGFYPHYYMRYYDTMSPYFEGHEQWYSRVREDTDFRRRILNSIVKSSGIWLHVEKIDRELIKRLYSLGLALPGENELEDWVRIDNEIGYIYMTYLAKSISQKKTMPIVTDTEESFASSIVFESEIFQDFDAQFEYKLANMLIATYLPKDINSVPIKKLFEIRKKYSDERTRFFDLVDELSRNIQFIDSESALKDALQHHKESLIIQTKDLQKIYDSLGIETVVKFLGLSIPAVLVSLTGIIPVEYEPLGITAGIALGLAGTVNAVKKERTQLRSRPLSYLLNIYSELSADGIFKKIDDGIKGVRRWGSVNNFL